MSLKFLEVIFYLSIKFLIILKSGVFLIKKLSNNFYMSRLMVLTLIIWMVWKRII